MIENYFPFEKADVIRIHDKLHCHTNGFHSEQNLDFIFSMFDQYPEMAGIEIEHNSEKLIYMATYLLFHLVKSHCFNDGNKRTAFLSFGSFLRLNSFELNYNEEKVSEKLTELGILAEQGKSPYLYLLSVFQKGDQHEQKMIQLLFELAGANNRIQYNSPEEMGDIIKSLIRSPLKKFTMQDAPKVKARPALIRLKSDPKRVDAVVDELMKKYKHTLELLEKM